MRILITGGAGFIGSHVAEHLLSRNHDIIIIDNLSTGKIGNIPQVLKRFKTQEWEEQKLFLGVEGDIRDFDFYSIESPDAIFHLAAKPAVDPSIKDPLIYNEHNVVGSLRLFEYAASQKIPIIFSSSSAVYGECVNKKETDELNPLSPYALQKLICEQYLKLFNKLYGLEIVALRYFNVYGEKQSGMGPYANVIPIFKKQLKQKKPFTIYGNGENRRDFVYVKDVVEANIKAMEYVLSENYQEFEIFNIGSGKNYSVNEIANILDINHPKTNLPPRIEPKETLADISKAKEMLNWQPTTNLKSWLLSINQKE